MAGYSVFEAELQDVIPICHASIGGTRIVGRLTAGYVPFKLFHAVTRGCSETYWNLQKPQRSSRAHIHNRSRTATFAKLDPRFGKNTAGGREAVCVRECDMLQRSCCAYTS